MIIKAIKLKIIVEIIKTLIIFREDEARINNIKKNNNYLLKYHK